MPDRGVSFELERFAWAEGAPVLELSGRWRGSRARRLGSAALVVDVAGERRRLAAVTAPDAVVAGPDGSPWRAAFAWSGELEELSRAELEVGRDLVIELPVPDGSAPTDLLEALRLRQALEEAQRRTAADGAELVRLRATLEAAENLAEVELAAADRIREALEAAEARLAAERAERSRLQESVEAVAREVEAHRQAAERAVAEVALLEQAAETERIGREAFAEQLGAAQLEAREARREAEAAQLEARAARREADAARAPARSIGAVEVLSGPPPTEQWPPPTEPFPLAPAPEGNHHDAPPGSAGSAGPGPDGDARALDPEPEPEELTQRLRRSGVREHPPEELAALRHRRTPERPAHASVMLRLAALALVLLVLGSLAAILSAVL